MLKDELTEKEIKELDLVEIWFDGCLGVDEEISFRMKKCNRNYLKGFDLKTDNARFFHDHYGEGYGDDFYVVCPRKHVEEGKKLFAQGYVNYLQKKEDFLKKELKEKIDILETEKKAWENYDAKG